MTHNPSSTSIFRMDVIFGTKGAVFTPQSLLIGLKRLTPKMKTYAVESIN